MEAVDTEDTQNSQTLQETPEVCDEQDDDQQPGLMEELEKIIVAETSLHPHRRAEDLIKDHLGRVWLGCFLFNPYTLKINM